MTRPMIRIFHRHLRCSIVLDILRHGNVLHQIYVDTPEMCTYIRISSPPHTYESFAIQHNYTYSYIYIYIYIYIRGYVHEGINWIHDTSLKALSAVMQNIKRYTRLIRSELRHMKRNHKQRENTQATDMMNLKSMKLSHKSLLCAQNFRALMYITITRHDLGQTRQPIKDISRRSEGTRLLVCRNVCNHILVLHDRLYMKTTISIPMYINSIIFRSNYIERVV